MTSLSATQVFAAASEQLAAHGFSVVSDGEDLAGNVVRVFEDSLSIVAVASYPSWPALEQRWPAAQGLLVELMTEHLRRNEPKAWEGYLVLLTSDDSVQDQLAVDRIRRDTSRVRKIVATGSELTTVASVGDALLPVLPLALGGGDEESPRVLDRLPNLLSAEGVDEELSRLVVRAFEENRSAMDAIWTWRRSQ